MVEDLFKRPECTKEQGIEALELLAASFLAMKDYVHLNGMDKTSLSFHYMKRGMEESFQDPSNPLLKQPTRSVEAYQNRKESQIPEELARIEGNVDAFLMESLIIRERILGPNNKELICLVNTVARYHDFCENFDSCVRLHRRAVQLAQVFNYSFSSNLQWFTKFFHTMVSRNEPPSQEAVLEWLEKTILVYEKRTGRWRELQIEPLEEFEGELLLMKRDLHDLIEPLLRLLQLFVKIEVSEGDTSTCISTLVQKLFSFESPRKGNTLLHLAADGCWKGEYLLYNNREPLFKFPCIGAMRLLLTVGFDPNAINNEGNTPLHIAATLKPGCDNFLLLTNTLEVLLDEGAHHDFVNNDGKIAMDIAQSDEARWILSSKRKLELKCISARAVKTFGLHYLGLVPRTFEKYISMH